MNASEGPSFDRNHRVPVPQVHTNQFLGCKEAASIMTSTPLHHFENMTIFKHIFVDDRSDWFPVSQHLFVPHSTHNEAWKQTYTIGYSKGGRPCMELSLVYEPLSFALL